MRTAKVVVALCLFLAAHAAASGNTGVYAIVEKVVFEPEGTTAANAERAQVWGAFAFILTETMVMGRRLPQPTETVTSPRRGYLYFALPPDGTPAQLATVRTEWADLKTVAGTGQAVSFGQWGFFGNATTAGATGGSHGAAPSGRTMNNLSVVRLIPLDVQSAVPPVTEAVPYVTNAGIVKIAGEGSHAEIVKKLKDALAR
jgi:hypothetical protein